MNSKDIQNKIKGLYKHVGSDHFEQSDAKILRYERTGMAQAEVWKNYTDEQRANRVKKVVSKNEANWSSQGIYTVISPGSDMLDFYDAKWQEYIDDLGIGKIYTRNNGRNQIGLVKPSVIYKLRFESGPLKYGWKSVAWDILKDHIDQDSVATAFHLDAGKKMYKWLTQEKSKQYEFTLLERAYDFIDEQLFPNKSKVHRGEITPHARKDKNRRFDTIWWRKEAAGWAIKYTPKKVDIEL